MPSGSFTSRSAGMTPHLGVGAGRPAGVGHAVARLDVRDARADRLDDPGAFAAQAARQRQRVEAGAVVGVDEVDPDGGVADAGLALAGSPTSTSSHCRTSGPPVLWRRMAFGMAQAPSLLLRPGDRPEPDQRLRAAAAARQRLAVGREGQRLEPGLRPVSVRRSAPGLRVPELDGLVLAPARHRLAVGGEGHRVDLALVPLEDVSHLSRFDVPEPDRAVLAAAGQQLAVRGEGDASRPPACPSSTSFTLPVCASHRRAVLSELGAGQQCSRRASRRTIMTRCVCPVSVCFSSPVCTSHRRIVLSTPPLASVFWSGEKSTERTMSVCPSRVRITLPVCGSQSRTVLSPLPLASRSPFGENATP